MRVFWIQMWTCAHLFPACQPVPSRGPQHRTPHLASSPSLQACVQHPGQTHMHTPSALLQMLSIWATAYRTAHFFLPINFINLTNNFIRRMMNPLIHTESNFSGMGHKNSLPCLCLMPSLQKRRNDKLKREKAVVLYVKITFKNNQLTVCTFRGPDVSKRI